MFVLIYFDRQLNIYIYTFLVVFVFVFVIFKVPAHSMPDEVEGSKLGEKKLMQKLNLI